MVRVGQIKLNAVVSTKKSVRKATKNRPMKLRPSLTVGTVCILLTGQFRGRRVIMLDHLKKSGLLLVTGPYKVNGVPLRRVNARQVIATSTKVNVKVDTKKFNDEYFKKAISKGKDAAEEFLEKKQKPTLDAGRKADQKAVDDAIIKALDPTMKKYLKTKFALSNGQNAHELKF